jgi:hypothetical protein
MGQTIQLPKTTKEGKPRISYSQLRNYRQAKSFNLKIDQRKSDWSLIRDIKTASKSSAAQYYKEDYNQTKIYALKPYMEMNFIPETEVLIVERKGNCMYGGGRENLKVGSEVWTVEILPTEEQLEIIKSEIIKDTYEISEYYKSFKKFNIKY